MGENPRRLFQRVKVGTDKIHKGTRLRFYHAEKCKGKKRSRDGSINEAGFGIGKPKTKAELIGMIPAVMHSQGCVMGGLFKCGIDKTDSMGIYMKHSQDSEYVPESSSETGTTGSTEVTRQSMKIEWDPSFEGADLAEKELYRGMKVGNTSDEDYVPLGTRDVAMEMQGGENTEKTGLGDSVYAQETLVVPETQETVEYTIGPSMKRDCMEAMMEIKDEIEISAPKEVVPPTPKNCQLPIEGQTGVMKFRMEDLEEENYILNGKVRVMEEKLEWCLKRLTYQTPFATQAPAQRPRKVVRDKGMGSVVTDKGKTAVEGTPKKGWVILKKGPKGEGEKAQVSYSRQDRKRGYSVR
ncbi:hypothetical protein C7212DRAFT_364585 [Tuber magnatum]|uniref:Uncharacterized protein n=1 Tax=Tuber magnatum TaxID=42249 RepID=A0A317SM10_9PEZI|nr:hypothetical protein C7212DRAFT_364585 [Tuber magnatum]